ncbi:MAG: RIP metalloprotease RseP [Candidatus Levybacteria bacterium RBG_16_35_11]|mgnify:CR=1 FL=1|nr:MAG: RIP metalloprotease RseP [Candidatus Levybacteria bacterium RBG_16_35_11]
MLITVVVFIAILSVLVLVHEFGHFLVAKKLKIKVEEFGFGLPPKALSIKRGETVYSINYLPIGGFVKLYGEDEAGSGSVRVKKEKTIIKDQSRAFFARPVWQRAAVSIAGVVMNFLLAVLIISYLFSAVGVPVLGDKVVISNIVKNSPAAAAGLRNGDVIVSIDREKVENPNQLISKTKKHLGEKLNLEIKRDGQTRALQITPRKKYPSNEGPMGVTISQDIKTVKYPWYQAPFLGTREALYESWLIASGIATVLYQLVFFGISPQGVAGPVGIAELTGQFVQIGPYAVLSFVSLLSLNLAILNILPFPALDGGRLLFIVIEAVTGRKVNRKFESYAHAVGMAILLSLIALITVHDFVRLFTGQPLLPKIQ